MSIQRLPKGFFDDVAIKTKPARSDDIYETPISISKEAAEGKRSIKVSLKRQSKLNKVKK